MKQSDTSVVQKALKVLDLNDAAAATPSQVNSIQINVNFGSSGRAGGGQSMAFTITSANAAAWTALTNLLNSWLPGAVTNAQNVLTAAGVTRG